jgi:hypothetical protein
MSYTFTLHGRPKVGSFLSLPLAYSNFETAEYSQFCPM